MEDNVANIRGISSCSFSFYFQNRLGRSFCALFICFFSGNGEEGFKKEDDETASLVKELREMNSRLEEIEGYCFEIIDDEKISKVARNSIRTLKEEMKLFSEKHGFEKSVVIDGKFISLEKLDTREVQYYNRVVRFLQGNVLKDLYQLKPEKTSHA